MPVFQMRVSEEWLAELDRKRGLVSRSAYMRSAFDAAPVAGSEDARAFVARERSRLDRARVVLDQAEAKVANSPVGPVLTPSPFNYRPKRSVAAIPKDSR